MNNDLKYVLLPSVENRRRPPKFQPWYRERLKMKYPTHIDTKNWKFVKDGLDDFRNGLPPSHENIILKSEKGPGPVVLSQNRRIKANASNVGERLKDHQIYFSRELPTAEKRRELIDNYLSTLLDHPMAFFPHFNELLPPDIYERVTKLLEAELLTATDEEQKENFSTSFSVPLTRPETSASDKDTSEHSIKLNTQMPAEESETKSISTRPGRSTIVYDESGNQWDSEELERKQKNPYRWYIEKQREKQKARGPTQDEVAASEMETHLRSVSEQFCDWLNGHENQSNIDIDPGTVRNLFSTAYDTKPSLSVPIKIVEMTRIPPELREGAEETMLAHSEETRTKLPELHLSAGIPKLSKSTTFSTDQDDPSKKYRYGAWYLPKNLWQRSLITEELRDPKEIKAELEDATRKREEQSNARLAPMHGVDAFKEYLVEKNVHRLPKIITEIEKYRREHPRDLTNSTAELQTNQTNNSKSD